MRFGKGKSIRPRTPWCRTKRSNPASEDEPLRKRRAAPEGFVVCERVVLYRAYPPAALACALAYGARLAGTWRTLSAISSQVAPGAVP
jgi:hypothetical protein